MNCRPGQLAYVKAPGPLYGLVVKVVALDHIALREGIGEMWLYEGYAHCEFNGERYISLRDSILRPLSDPGDDAKDEAGAWLPPVPASKETA